MGWRSRLWVTVGLLAGTAAYVLAEEITLTTYYPSPRGVYRELRVGAGGPVSSPSGRLHVMQFDPSGLALRVDDEDNGAATVDLTPFVIDNAGNVGIGTTGPTATLDVNGQIRIRGGSPGGGKVLTSDAAGLASWQTAGGGGGGPSLTCMDVTGNVASGGSNIILTCPLGFKATGWGSVSVSVTSFFLGETACSLFNWSSFATSLSCRCCKVQ